MTEPLREIDLRHLGHERVICCYRQDDVLVDPGPAVCADTLLEALDGWRPRAILLTHVHLDHAGGTGGLVRRWPDVEVWVHELGARHLVDPSKLVASATRIYGGMMDTLWGPIEAVPADRLRVFSDVPEHTGDWRIAATPGHAIHHVSYLHEPTGTAFAGDVAGVRIADGPTLPGTPPPDVDPPAWRRSIEVLREWDPARVAVTHFGAKEDVAAQLGELEARLDGWVELAARIDAAEFAAQARALIAPLPNDTRTSYEMSASMDGLWAGIDRYRRRNDNPVAKAPDVGT